MARRTTSRRQNEPAPDLEVCVHGDHVVIRVTHYWETVIGDVDNLAKPIQDALQGVVYRNDRQVSDTTGNHRRIDGSFVVRYMSMPLAAAFSEGLR